MKTSELFRVLVGYTSNLPPNTILNTDVLHRIIVDKFEINAKESTLKHYFNILANAGFSVKKRRIAKQKQVYYIVDERGKWPFKLSLSEVKEMSSRRGSANVEMVSSRKELGFPLISMYEKTEFEDPGSVIEVKEEKDLPGWHDIDFSQLTNEDLKDILTSTRISDKSLSRMFRRVLADTFNNQEILVKSLGEYDEELTKIKECKSNLEDQNKSLKTQLSVVKKDYVAILQLKESCESRIKTLEETNDRLSQQILNEQESNKKLETQVSYLQRENEKLTRKVSGMKLDGSDKFVTIKDVMQSKGG